MPISHADHDHPNTTAARTACRKAMAATGAPVGAVRKLAEQAGLVTPARMTVVPRTRGDGGVVKGMKAAAGRLLKTPANLPATLPAELRNAVSIAWREGCGVVEGYRLNDAEQRILIGGTVAQVALIWAEDGRCAISVRSITSSISHRVNSAQRAMDLALGNDDWPWINAGRRV